jgi:hypothetical protein
VLSRRSKTVLGGWSAAVVFTSALVTGGGVAAAAEPCETTPSDRVPGIEIEDPACEFTALPGATAYTGILSGSAYRIEVPDDWNGDLVMYAHGYAGTGNVVSVSNPQLREFYIENGYAWAASSYRQNGYNVGDGVQDTHDLMVHFPKLTGERAPRETYMTGVSMGGEITAVSIERYRGQFTAAMPTCGVLGANDLFDYFLGANATAFALTEAPLEYPDSLEAGTAYTPEFVQAVKQEVMPGLGIADPPGPFFAPSFATADGAAWVGAVTQLSGGDRPGAAGAVAYWSSFGFGALSDVPFLFGVYPGLNGGTLGYADGNVADNSDTVYQLDGNPAVSPAEAELNADVLRVEATATETTNPARTQLPDVDGDAKIPVLSLHNLGDLFVPFSMEQSYARKVAENASDLFVSRAIRGTGHCEFTDEELATGFTDLVAWADTGVEAAGDDILNPAVVADPAFGCRFTGDPAEHVWFGGPCPPA